MSTGPFPGGRHAAISLSYDDGLPCHRTGVAPALSRRGLHGTFFCPANSDDLHAHVEGWRELAAAGHEIGNHTCFHPCRAKDGAGWPDRAFDLRSYNRTRIASEVLLAQRVLCLVDGREQRAYGATCGHTTIGADGAEESFLDDLRPFTTHVRAARGGALPLERPAWLTGSYLADAKTAADTIAVMEPLLANGGWLLVEMHGVGAGTHPMFVTDEDHERILDWMASQAHAVWSATVSEAAAVMHALPQ